MSPEEEAELEAMDHFNEVLAELDVMDLMQSLAFAKDRARETRTAASNHGVQSQFRISDKQSSSRRRSGRRAGRESGARINQP